VPELQGVSKLTKKEFVVEVRRNRLKGWKKKLSVVKEPDHAATGQGHSDKKPEPARTATRLSFPVQEKPFNDPTHEPDKPRRD
jgi:hypothetical protein